MHRFRKLVTTIGATLTAVALLATPALAWTDRIEGRSENLQPGGESGYYFWHDDNGLHLYTTGPGPRHLFHATLQTTGEFRDVHLTRIEGDDAVAVHEGGHEMHVWFETWNGIDGVDFRIEGGHAVLLSLRRDGELVANEAIYLGVDGKHPAHNPMVEHR